jgi:predicted transcriptional regulator
MMILDLISSNKNHSQANLARKLNVAVSMINKYINEMEREGLLNKDNINGKKMNYVITKKGVYERDYLLTTYLDELLEMYKKAKHRIEEKFEEIIEKKYRQLLLFGAGETGKVVLNVYNDSYKDKLEILGIVDENMEKINKKIWGVRIISIEEVKKLEFQKIFITSFAYRDRIYKKLTDENIPGEKIDDFFGQEIL